MRNIITDIAGMACGDRTALKNMLRRFLNRDWFEEPLEGERASAREAVHHLMELYITVIANGRFVASERPIDDYIEYMMACKESRSAEEWFEYGDAILTVASLLMIASQSGIDSL